MPLIWDLLTIEQWSSWSSGNQVSFESPEVGHGRGEHKVVEELKLLGRDARTAGGFEDSYDVIELDDRKWEVKEISATNLEVRPGKSGISDAKELIRIVHDLVQGLLRAYEFADSLDYYRKGLFLSSGLDITPVREMLSDTLRKIGEGSIAKGAIYGKTSSNPIGLMDVLNSLFRFIKERGRVRWAPMRFDFLESQKISIGDECSYDEYLMRLRLCGKPLPKEARPEEIFCSYLLDPAVKRFVFKPERLENVWKKSASVGGTFSEVFGIIIVHETDGFALLSLGEAEKHLIFERITQGRSKFRLVKRPKNSRRSTYVKDGIVECDSTQRGALSLEQEQNARPSE